MNILKLLTRDGRRQIAADYAKQYLTPQKLAEAVSAAVSKALEHGAENISDERCALIARGCERGGVALIHITAAVSPDSENGKRVSDSERAFIASDVLHAIEDIVTQEGINSIIDKAVLHVL